VRSGRIEQLGRWRRIRSHGIDAVFRHHRDVVSNARRLGEFIANAIGTKRPVRDAPDIELVAARPQELAAGPDASRRGDLGGRE
jgi:hypothetical protein